MGNVVSSLTDVPATLTPGTNSQTLSLGQVDTTGLANGVYSVRVSLRATDGSPLPGQSLEAPFLGTLVAPRGQVSFGTASAQVFRGRFFGLNLDVRPDIHLVCDPTVTAQ